MDGQIWLEQKLLNPAGVSVSYPAGAPDPAEAALERESERGHLISLSTMNLLLKAYLVLHKTLKIEILSVECHAKEAFDTRNPP